MARETRARRNMSLRTLIQSKKAISPLPSLLGLRDLDAGRQVDTIVAVVVEPFVLEDGHPAVSGLEGRLIIGVEGRLIDANGNLALSDVDLVDLVPVLLHEVLGHLPNPYWNLGSQYGKCRPLRHEGTQARGAFWKAVGGN